MENCLVEKRLIVRHIQKETSRYTDKKHVMFGGMMEGAFKTYTLPKTSNGEYVQCLTKDEEQFLENYMNLKPGTLSLYRKEDNYWDKYRVRLMKDDTYLRLSVPADYIKYKVLLANKRFICPDIETLQKLPQATYEYVIVDEEQVSKVNKQKFTSTSEAYMLLGSIQSDKYKLRVILEMLEKRPVSISTSLDTMLSRINEYLVASPSKFLAIAKDEYLNTKVLISKAIDMKLIKDRGGLLYLASDGSPLCEEGNPTLDIAAQYLNMPRHANVKFQLEGFINTPEAAKAEVTPVPESEGLTAESSITEEVKLGKKKGAKSE